MAEDTPILRNKGLLITAGVIAAFVVIIYQFHISRIRESQKEENTTVLQLQRNIDAGEQLKPSDLKAVSIKTVNAKLLGDIYRGADPLNDVPPGSTLVSPVRRLDLLRKTHLQILASDSPSAGIREGMEYHVRKLDRGTAPGEMLNIGDRVAIYGKLAVNGKPLQTYPIIKGVRVLARGGMVGHRGTAARRGSYGSSTMRNYSAIGVELLPETVVQLQNLRTHLVGGLTVTVLPPSEARKWANKAPELLKELRELKAVDGKVVSDGD